MNSSENKTQLGPEDIKRLIPHRYPFLLVDRVLSVTPQEIKALKNVTSNEPFFQGHFPQEPIMPGVLIIEALAQTAAICAIKQKSALQSQQESGEDLKPPSASVYFVGIDGAKFRRKVVPGDTLLLQVVITRPGTSRIAFEGKAFVEGALACEAKMMAMIGK